MACPCRWWAACHWLCFALAFAAAGALCTAWWLFASNPCGHKFRLSRMTCSVLPNHNTSCFCNELTVLMLLTQRFQSLRTTLWRMMKRNLPSRDLQRHPTLATVGLPAVSSTLDTLRSARSTRQHARRTRSAPRAQSVRAAALRTKLQGVCLPSTCLVSSPTFVVEQQPAFVRHCLLRLVFHPPWRLLLLLAQMRQLLLLLQARFWKLKGYTWREACTQRLPDLVFCNQFCTATALIIHQGPCPARVGM